MGKGKLQTGLVQVYTGEGKGKTTAALGLAWRALGRGLRVCFVQFLKGHNESGEQLIAGAFGENLTMVQISAEAKGRGRKSTAEAPWWQQPFGEADYDAAREALEYARRVLRGGEYDMVVCDEINTACDAGLIEVSEMLALIKDRREDVELVLTGRKAPAAVIEAADLVTEVRMVKHPFEKGIKARKGIEY